MALLTSPFLSRFPDAVVNVHPSLLPAFPGMRAIEQAIDYGVKVFGVTVHFVLDDGGVDTGPVIVQGAIELANATDPAGGRARRCARSSTRCCPRPSGSSRAARCRATRTTRAGSSSPAAARPSEPRPA